MASLDYRLNPLFTIKECSSCRSLYNKGYCCTPDLSQQPPQDCVKCGNPVEGPNCQRCALWRKKLKEVWFTICHKNGIYQDLLNTYESSDDDTNVVNAPREPFFVKQDLGENSSQSPPQINHNCCYECGDLLDGIFCQQCTCKSCGKGAHIGYNCPPKAPIISNPEPCNQTIDELPQTLPSFDPTCYSKKENLLPYVSKPNFVDDSPNVFSPPPQPPMYSCEFCGNDARYGHYCTPQKEEDQAAKDQYWNIPICYNDDDDEYSFATQEYLKKFSSAITPDLPKSDSLIMEEEHLDTIPKTESDELIKSSVEDLVHTPSESDGISEGECDLPVYDDFSPKKDEVLDDIISIPSGNGNDHFNAESSLIESVLNRDKVISSPKIDFLIEEFAGELALIALIPPGIVEADLDPKEDIRFIENLMYNNSFPRPSETLKDDSETVIDSNNDYFSSDDDSYENIDYVDASPPDAEIVSLEIDALKDNPTPSSDFMTKSSSTSLNLFLEETNTVDNSLPETETFRSNLEEISSGSTTTRSDLSLPDYEAFNLDDNHIKEKSSGSTTTHADFSLPKYDSFIFYLSINPFPPADRSNFYHEEFADELAHIISPPDLECFYFKSEPDPGDLTSINPGIRENVSTTNEILPKEDDQSPLFAFVVWIFLAFLTYPVVPPYLLSCGNEDTIFDPDIFIYHSFMTGVSHRSGTFMKFNVYPNHLIESPMEILSSTCSPMNQ
ncbi:hypothetical protein Tco_0841795 [Tanacetum coccineum]|uniref:CCHC-type domain-containing protein n=1 Tax=Tanacetum coccineum TaxID=301880 RepID=A0ABQ5B0U4_9ASTR